MSQSGPGDKARAEEPAPPFRLEDLIDIAQFQMLQDRLNEIYSFPSSIIDNDGRILTATAWQDICTKFHRRHPECERECVKSDQYILQHLSEANPAVTYQCPHGLVDNATPIIIEGIHYGNFFTGQFFLKAPDLDFFRAQARTYGFDEAAYLEAVRKVPIWTKAQLRSYLYFIKGLIQVISGIGLKNLREIKAGRRIRESEIRYRTLVEQLPDLVWHKDRRGVYLSCNRNYAEANGLRPEEIIGRSDEDFYPAEVAAAFRAADEQVLETGLPWEGEEIGSIQGRRRWLHTRKAPLIDESGARIGTIGVGRDITERKVAEERLRTALAEKEVLLRELYHRTKNNLQVVISLLNMQAAALADPELSGALKETQGRIRAMALVHQKLYQARNLSRIDLGEYLRDLAAQLEVSCGIDPSRIELVLDTDKASVSIDTAIPCGMIVNELVANAIRHAFPEGRKGRILIQLRRASDGEMILTVSDDGIGLPRAEAPAKRRAIGWDIIKSLSSQIDADLRMTGENGLTCRLAFREAAKRNPV